MENRRCSNVKEKRKNYSQEFKQEAVRLITDKGYSIAEASRNLGIDYSVLRRWKKQLMDDPQNAFPGKGRLKPADEELRQIKRELDRVKEERDILKKALAYFAEDQK
jgi:transposase